MKIESIRLKNFRALRDVHLRDLPGFCVVVGANGTGKSSLLAVFDFLRNAMARNVNAALAKLGGGRGFHEVRSRGAEGPIEIELELLETSSGTPTLISYQLVIDEENGRAFVARELLKYQRGSAGKPWHFVDFTRGTGSAMTNARERETLTLKSPELLAIKALAQFEKFPAAAAIATRIERWHVSDLRVSRARAEQDAGYAEHLSREGENLALVLEHLKNRHPAVLEKIVKTLARRVPGIDRVETKVTEEGRVLLRFRDTAFEEPFLARDVSDGTLKALMVLVLLHDPSPHPLLCIDGPESQLSPSLLEDLAEDLRAYTNRGGQVFVSTHSPDLLNAVTPKEAFWLVKDKGYTNVRRASEDPQIVGYVNEGHKLGNLWKQGLLKGANAG